jgi:hypothetical protein
MVSKADAKEQEQSQMKLPHVFQSGERSRGSGPDYYAEQSGNRDHRRYKQEAKVDS